MVLTGITLAAAVVTWAWSPIKFQADMGILMAFMFIWNMLGALILLPALACFFFGGARSSQLVTASQQLSGQAVGSDAAAGSKK